MRIIEENGFFKLDINQKELEYNLEMLLKANNNKPGLNLNLDEIKKISEISAKELMKQENYPIFLADNGRANEFYKAVETYWFDACQHEINTKIYSK